MIRHSRLRSVTTVLIAAGIAACGGGGGEGGGSQDTAPSVVVIGQASFQANQANQGGGVGPRTLNTPMGNAALAEDGTVFVPDSFNSRVLGFRKVPETSNAPADFVVGKQDPSHTGGQLSRTEFGRVLSVSIAGGKMAVVDAVGNRVLIYSTVPATNAEPAGFVVGQTGFTSGQSQGCTPTGLDAARSAVLTPDGKLVVADTNHHRVLIWNSIEQDGPPADAVLGQSDFVVNCAANDSNQDGTAGPSAGANTLNEPFGVWSDGVRLIVADTGNHRVLIWNKMPVDSTENFKTADILLGQTTFTGTTLNDANGDRIEDPAPGATTLSSPMAVHSDGLRLAIADTGNNRVLLWNALPTTSGTPPDRVIGQRDFKLGAPNDGNGDGAEDPAPADKVFAVPRGVLLQGQKLFVTDTGNNRVLIIPLD